MQYRNQTPPDMYEQTVALLKQVGYDVTRTNIKIDDPIPGDIQTMIVMMDQPLNERQMYEIDKLEGVLPHQHISLCRHVRRMVVNYGSGYIISSAIAGIVTGHTESTITHADRLEAGG